MGSTHVVEQLSFSLFLSILTFDFDSIFRSFLTFWGPNGLILGLWKGSKTVLGSTHVVEQLLFSIVPSTLSFDFGALLGYFWIGEGFKNCFGVYSCSWATFIFYVSFNFDLWIWFNFGVIFLLFGALMGYFWGWSRVRQLFWGLLM